MKPVPISRSTGAFTLIELLVVVGIIAVLASLLLPALTRAKRKSHQAACLQQLRQIGLSFRMYLDDHGDRFPDRRDLKAGLPGGYRPWPTWPPSDPRGGWAATTLREYLKDYNVWSCPGVKASPLSAALQVVQPVSTESNAPVAGYWLWRFDRMDSEVPLDNFWGKTESQAIIELVAANNPVAGQPAGPTEVELAVDVYFPVGMTDLPAEIRGRAAHPGGRNRLFLDGHALFVRDRRITR